MALLNVLVVNTGSSSLKISCFNNKLERIHEAYLSGIQSTNPHLSIDGKDYACPAITSFKDAIDIILKEIPDFKPEAIGHRIVHGGTEYRKATLITDKVLQDIRDLSVLAPLHNPAGVSGIEAAKAHFPNLPQVAVFDTSFHHTLPPEAFTYGLPYQLCQKHHIKRYGFHGIAHSYLWKAYIKLTQQPTHSIVTLHLGNGCSATAIKQGKSIDTSMGFTPLEGLLMSSRAGDMDVSIVNFLVNVEKIPLETVTEMLNQKSGLLGISEISSDMKTLLAEENNSSQAKLAIDLFCYRILKYIGAYQMTLQGCDAIVFSGGIGENAAVLRKRIIEKLTWQGVVLDSTANDKAKGLKPGTTCLISGPASKLAVYVVGVDENHAIAEDVSSLVLERGI